MVCDDCLCSLFMKFTKRAIMKLHEVIVFPSPSIFEYLGTAGVWRLAAIRDAGGWNNRTTVEDMDLSLRAYLRGWQFVFLNNVEVRHCQLCSFSEGCDEEFLLLLTNKSACLALQCVNEIPSTYAAFRHQQHRWSCGPMQLWRSAMQQVWESDVGFSPSAQHL